jgi:hypothetical protein
MSKVFKPSIDKAFLLFNPNSFFDNCIVCPSGFDRACVYTIESGLQDLYPDPIGALRIIMKIINEMEEDKDPDLAINTFTLRNCYFYLILMMDYCENDTQTLMMIQMSAMHLCQMYCTNLDKLYKTDYYTLVDEVDKCVTFQNSSNCVTPNILKENFLEMIKTKEIKNYFEHKCVNVDFTVGMDDEEITELEEGFEEDDKMLESFMNQMLAQMEEAQKLEKKSKKPVVKKIGKKPKK